MSKKPLRLSDDANDLQSVEFGATELACIGGLDLEGLGTHTIKRSGDDMIFEDVTAGGPHTLEDLLAIGGGSGVGGVQLFFFMDGATENKWLGMQHHGQPSGPQSDDVTTPWIAPYGGEIVAATFVNKIESADTDLEIYKNGVLQTTWLIQDAKWATKTDFTPVSYVAGDQISVFMRKPVVGGTTKPDDPHVYLYGSFTDSTQQELSGATL